MAPYRQQRERSRIHSFVEEDGGIVRRALRAKWTGAVVSGAAALGSTALTAWLAAGGEALILVAGGAVVSAALAVAAVRSARVIPSLLRDLREGKKERFVASIEGMSVRGGYSDESHMSARHEATIAGETYRIDEVIANRCDVGDFVLIERGVHSRVLLWMEPASGEEDGTESSASRLLSTEDA
ncbi:MAG: hypothetical protein JRI23_00650 [Deltaproteobacteria bacterium]|jgi:hypothetical protein|nr:hypothetical protein [Deltaproteobacteria bacterium]MBW2529959.1 hypothetical protein [Deltaproteobacteria bacterium]